MESARVEAQVSEDRADLKQGNIWSVVSDTTILSMLVRT